MTIDQLIQSLQLMRDEYGGDFQIGLYGPDGRPHAPEWITTGVGKPDEKLLSLGIQGFLLREDIAQATP